MALASYRSARSVVELSLSPLYHYQYSSISKSIAALDSPQRRKLSRHIVELAQRYGPQEVRLLQTDSTPMRKPHSPTLRERTFIATADNEVIRGNRPLSVGYEISFVNLCHEGWSVPLSVRRVGQGETATECAIKQLSQLSFERNGHLSINLLDSKYGKAAYFCPSYGYEDLVSIVRLRGGMRVWERAVRYGTGGNRGTYGTQYYLLLESDQKEYIDNKTRTKRHYYRQALLERPADESIAPTNNEGADDPGAPVAL